MDRTTAIVCTAGLLLVGSLHSAEPPHAPALPELPAIAEPAPTPRPTEMPAVDIPQEWRQRNWAPHGSGSCVHASMVMCMRWQGLHALADWWRQTYHSGEYASRLHKRLDQAGVRFAGTTSGDVAFLEWACRTRRGCGVTWKPSHFCLLVHLDSQRAGILDNNAIDRIEWVPRDEFLRGWRRYGGWATTVVYDPPPAKPWIR